MPSNATQSFEEYLDWISASWELFAPKTQRRPKPKAPKHPGAILQTEYLNIQCISQSALARRLGCSHAKVNDVIKGRRAITVRFALDLERVLKVPADYWLLLQIEYDLYGARLKG